MSKIMCWDKYFMSMVGITKEKSTCLRRQVGALVTIDNRIVATGYNGVPSKVTHCESVGCLRDKLKVPSGERHELCRGLHAEQNCIVSASRSGVSLKGGTLYCTTQPCIICTKMIINAGISEVVYEESYKDGLAIEMFNEIDIIVRQYSEVSY